MVQREREAQLSAEVASLQQRLEAEEASAFARCDALRHSLQKQEAHSAALEAQLASRPTSQQVWCAVISPGYIHLHAVQWAVL